MVDIDVVVDGIVALWDQVGVERSSLVGLGFGGSVALYLAIRHPERVDRVVACCCRARQPDDRRQFWRDRQAVARAHGLTGLARLTVERWLDPSFRAAQPEVGELLQAAFLRNSVEGYLAYVDAFADMDFTDLVGRLKAPTRLVAAEHDHGGGPVSDMRALTNALPGATLAVVAAVGHICNHEAPEEVIRLIEAHLTVV